MSLPIWPLPETPSTGVRPGSVGFPLTDEPSERRFACLLLATSIPAFAFPTGSSRCPLVLHGLCTHGASLGPLTVSGLDGAILRFLVLESLLCDAGGNYVARPKRRAASARPKSARSASEGLALRGVGNGRAGPEVGSLACCSAGLSGCLQVLFPIRICVFKKSVQLAWSFSAPAETLSSCRGDSHFLKPGILVLEALLCEVGSSEVR